MSRVALPIHAPQRQTCLEALRIVLVCGCAIALIAAGQALPFTSL